MAEQLIFSVEIGGFHGYHQQALGYSLRADPCIGFAVYDDRANDEEDGNAELRYDQDFAGDCGQSSCEKYP